MDKTLFEYLEYKQYILDKIDSLPNHGRGVRRRIAEHVGCQIAYVSHVLAGERHFSLEQAEAITRFFDFNESEADFFLILVEYNRAGTLQLQEFLLRQLKSKKSKHLKIKNRVGIKSTISEENKLIYYSSWHYQAIRMAITIPQIKTAEDISKKLEIPKGRVHEVLSFLIKQGLAQENQNGYTSTETPIHLSSDSPLISKLHSNWRIHSLKSFDRKNEEDFHYSGAVTLSDEDFYKVREIMMKSLLKSHDVIRPSKAERICVLALDFYEM